jgi:uncharacterized membrane protein YkvA (DUF1232 family)
MPWIELLKIKAGEMKRQVSALYYAAQDKRVGWLPKIIIGVTVLYALSPIDLIPDFIPVLGYLDDLIIVPALIALAMRLIPKEVIEDAKKRLESEPVSLKKNWTFAVIFIALWALVIYAVAKALIKMFIK